MAKLKTELSEYYGLRYFRKMSIKYPLSRIDEKVHILDAKERYNIRKISRNATINSAFIGTLSSIASLIILFIAGHRIINYSDFLLKQNMDYVVTLLVVTILVSIVEMIILFFDSLKKTYQITTAAHTQLFSKDDKEYIYTKSIVRAALEIPNPQSSDIQINPRKESKKAKLIFSKIYYKIRATLTRLIFKLIIKNMIGKAVARAYISIVSIPVVAFWNAYETRKMFREIIVRVIGPSLVCELKLEYKKNETNLSKPAKIQIIRAIASSIISTEDLHPNLEYMYKEFYKLIDIDTKEVILDNTSLFLEDLKNLNDFEKKIVLQILTFSAIIDGQIKKREDKLLFNAFEKCNMVYDKKITKELLNNFKTGQLIELNF